MKMSGVCALLLLAAPALACTARPTGDTALHARWLDLWNRLEKRGATGDPEAVFDAVAAKYSDSHRAYHTLAHVEQVLGEFDSARSLAEDPDAVECALWFHDVEYGIPDHEEESARYAESTLVEHGVSEEWAGRVHELILATRHDGDPGDPDARLVADIDMTILGQPRDRFDAYEREVRAEYTTWIQEGDPTRFDRGRAALLKRFLAQPVIYYTEYFRQKYEESARANLQYSIQRLEADSGTKPSR